MDTIRITKDRHSNDNTIDEIYWLLQAVDKKHKSLSHVMVQRHEAYTTNGHILLCCDVAESWEDGTYEVMKATKSEIVLSPSKVDFPNIDMLWPEGKPKTTIANLTNIGPKDNGSDLGFVCAQIIRTMTEGYSININYTKTALAGHTGWSMEYYGEGDPLVFKNATRGAIIMPLYR